MAEAAPVSAGERVETLDVVRGFALLGILLMNIVAMGLPMAAYFNPAALGPPCPACQTGVLLVVTWPRPTIAQIMQLPLDQLRQYRLPFQ
jgi:uncharacterized membrane protein YeiB